jgi:hypothetical protein
MAFHFILLKFPSGYDENTSKVKCPINGVFHGKLPDDEDLCSRIFSDCSHPDIMTYEIFPCNAPHVAYETRIYRCIGHWSEEKNKNVYTLTQRVDVVNTFECFVGLMTNSEDNIIIREAGQEGNCYKLDPLSFGMEMNRTGGHSNIIMQKCEVNLIFFCFIVKCSDTPNTNDVKIVVKQTTDNDSSTKYEILSNEIDVDSSK